MSSSTKRTLPDDDEHENHIYAKSAKLSNSNGANGSSSHSTVDVRSTNCPFLDTINRRVLDFDFEKLCSICLSHLNVYACMICGKYFQGRGPKSFAYNHAIECQHHVFLNLESKQFYCLPDNYEIKDQSLSNIVYVLDPVYSNSDLKMIDKMDKVIAYDRSLYYPGILGLNNIKENDYCNVILLLMSMIKPVRNYFLQPKNYEQALKKYASSDKQYIIVYRFGELIRKLWNPKNFKSHVSPHEMLQAIVLCSDKKYQFTKQSDAIELMTWFINFLHSSLSGSSRKPSIVSQSLRGRMKVWSKRIPPVDIPDADKQALLRLPEYQMSDMETNYFYLTCELPAVPLYPDSQKENIVPQVAIDALLAKFDGVTEKEYKTHNENFLKRFQLLAPLPKYLIICFKRFMKAYFVTEKNHTIVNFPIRNLDMIIDCLPEDDRPKYKNKCYDLVANIVHDGEVKGSYRIFLLHEGTQKWFEVQDLHVDDLLPETIPLSESYVQLYKLVDKVVDPDSLMATA